MLTFCALLFAQEEAPKPIIYNQHKNEIAIDFQSLLHKVGSDAILVSGTNLIYKRRFGEKRFVSVNEKKALRFQLGGNVDVPISTDTVLNQGGFPVTSFFNNNNSYTRLTTSIGIEWQKQIEPRLQLFYGVDLGGSYQRSKGVQSLTYISGTLTSYTEGISNSIGIPVNGFMGIKVFIHPRFSASIESSVLLGINFEENTSNRHYFDNFSPTELLRSDKRSEFYFGMDYLRYLNLSYYF